MEKSKEDLSEKKLIVDKYHFINNGLYKTLVFIS
jgi:hypothetical protein